MKGDVAGRFVAPKTKTSESKDDDEEGLNKVPCEVSFVGLLFETYPLPINFVIIKLRDFSGGMTGLHITCQKGF